MTRLLMIWKPRGWGGEREGKCDHYSTPGGNLGHPREKEQLTLFSCSARGEKVTDGVTNWVMGSLKAKLFEREML